MFDKVTNKLLNQEELTPKEAECFLSTLCNNIRERNNIEDPMAPVYKLCFETSRLFGGIALINYGCDIEAINIKKLLEIPLTHYANFIRLNVKGKAKLYLVDMTYSQFFDDYIVLDDVGETRGKRVSKSKSFEKIENEPFVEELRRKGFIEVNEIILKKYIDGFLDACGVKVKNKLYGKVNDLAKIIRIKNTSKR